MQQIYVNIRTFYLCPLSTNLYLCLSKIDLEESMFAWTFPQNSEYRRFKVQENKNVTQFSDKHFFFFSALPVKHEHWELVQSLGERGEWSDPPLGLPQPLRRASSPHLQEHACLEGLHSYFSSDKFLLENMGYSGTSVGTYIGPDTLFDYQIH